jgi:hypothetical protein
MKSTKWKMKIKIEVAKVRRVVELLNVYPKTRLSGPKSETAIAGSDL